MRALLLLSTPAAVVVYLSLQGCGRTDFSAASARKIAVASEAVESSENAASQIAASGSDVINSNIPATSDQPTSPALEDSPTSTNDSPSGNPVTTGTENPTSTITNSVGTPIASDPLLTSSECSGFAGDDHFQTIDISQMGSKLALSPDSVVVLHVTGQVPINLDAIDTVSIKGLCIIASGGSSLTIDTSLVIAKMSYHGRGNGGSVINFGKTGILEQLVTDISGLHSLTIVGEKVDCKNLDLTQGGSSQISCKQAL